jgi:zinc/manganese transport system substrate-binding protein
MKKATRAILIMVLLLTACQSASNPSHYGKKTIVVTYSILGAVVKDLVGTDANVVVLVPNGQDPHEWEPSARDIEAVNKADLIIQNGLNLEGGLQKTLSMAVQQGVKTFIASDHITVRRVGQGEGVPNGTPEQMAGAADPHLWTDPLSMKQVLTALATHLKTDLELDEAVRALSIGNELDNLNNEIITMVSALPDTNRKLVTGHDSLGYFANRYGFKLVGAIIPSLSSQAEVSAADLASLKILVEENQVKAIFTELGTPPSLAQAIGRETGVKVIPLATHILPADGSYFTFMLNLSQTIVENLD